MVPITRSQCAFMRGARGALSSTCVSSAVKTEKTRAAPRVIVADKLRSYGATHREGMPSVEHHSHKGLNNRAENSHQPTRQRERAVKVSDLYHPEQRTTAGSLAARVGVPPTAGGR